MNIAVIGTSRRENEKRVPIHPRQIQQMPEKLRSSLFFQKGYGVPFGVEDDEIEALTGNPLKACEDLLATNKIILITKPVLQDFEWMESGTLVCGWIHTVQNSEITQMAIDKKLTIVAWENMVHRTSRGHVHIFNKNNEMAGYCGVQHALELRGIDGYFGPPRKIGIFSLGSVSRGAIYALKGHGFNNITVYMRRPSYQTGNKIPGIEYKQIVEDRKRGFNVVGLMKEKTPLIDELTSLDIIVNGLLQDPQRPVFFIKDRDIEKFTRECLVIDISCDIGMGFSFAQPTDFSNPVSKIGKITYYAVDHTPTLLWDSASWEISTGMLPYIQNLADRTDNKVLAEATDIKDGIIRNKDILAFQNRSPEYPHRRL